MDLKQRHLHIQRGQTKAGGTAAGDLIDPSRLELFGDRDLRLQRNPALAPRQPLIEGLHFRVERSGRFTASCGKQLLFEVAIDLEQVSISSEPGNPNPRYASGSTAL
jgi:hypothetical protein